jgi:hypothetical protein
VINNIKEGQEKTKQSLNLPMALAAVNMTARGRSAGLAAEASNPMSAAPAALLRQGNKISSSGVYRGVIPLRQRLHADLLME